MSDKEEIINVKNDAVQSFINHVKPMIKSKVSSATDEEVYPLDLRTNATKLREKAREMSEDNIYSEVQKTNSYLTGVENRKEFNNKFQQQYAYDMPRIPENSFNFYETDLLKNLYNNAETVKENATHEKQNASSTTKNNILFSFSANSSFVPSCFMNINIAFPGCCPYGYAPYHWLHNAAINDFLEIKERPKENFVQTSQFVFDNTSLSFAFTKQEVHQQIENHHEFQYDTHMNNNRLYTVEDSVRNNTCKMRVNYNSSIKSGRLSKRNSVKNLENGAAVAKQEQKQRRYRTAKPFICEVCLACFTLQANMKRHMKRQHQQFLRQQQENKNDNTGIRNTSVAELTFTSIKIEDQRSALQFQSSGINKSENFGQMATCSQKHLFGSLGDINGRKIRMSNQSYGVFSKKAGTVYRNDYQIVSNNLSQVKRPTFELPKVSCRDKDNELQKEEHAGHAIKDYECNDDDENDGLIIDEEVEESNKEEAALGIASIYQSSNTSALQDCVLLKYPKVIHGNENKNDFLLKERSKEEGNKYNIIRVESSSITKEDRSNSNATMMNNEKKSAYALAPNCVSCPYCFRKFPWTSALFRHITTHTREKPYKCSHCHSSFTTKSNCDRHSRQKHNKLVDASSNNTNDSGSGSNVLRKCSRTNRKSISRPYRCNICSMSTFSTQSNLQRHIITKHNNISNANGSTLSISEADIITNHNKISSPNGYTLSVSEADIKHNKISSPNGYSLSVSEADIITKHNKISSPNGYTLSVCETDIIAKHNNISNPDGHTVSLRQADIVSKPDNFSDQNNCSSNCENKEEKMSDTQENEVQNVINNYLELYSKIIDNAKLTVPKCSNILNQVADSSLPGSETCESSVESSASSHLRCQLNTESCSEKNEVLKLLDETHSCGSNFFTEELKGEESNTTNHIVSIINKENKGESNKELKKSASKHINRKALCQICRRWYWSAEDLRRHARTHTGERPFTCDICNTRFTLKHSMLRHRKKHCSL